MKFLYCFRQFNPYLRSTFYSTKSILIFTMAAHFENVPKRLAVVCLGKTFEFVALCVIFFHLICTQIRQFWQLRQLTLIPMVYQLHKPILPCLQFVYFLVNFQLSLFDFGKVYHFYYYNLATSYFGNVLLWAFFFKFW